MMYAGRITASTVKWPLSDGPRIACVARQLEEGSNDATADGGSCLAERSRVSLLCLYSCRVSMASGGEVDAAWAWTNRNERR